jgi:2,3-bisphosphoglycerate-independent phosphoglycerate mutase
LSKNFSLETEIFKDKASMESEAERIYRPTVLIVLDGWGVAVPLVARYPTVTLQASGEATGLPWGEVGNSEVGHMSIGAGRIVSQELSRINSAISSKVFFENAALLGAIDHVRKTGGVLHIAGLVSPGGVHSHIDHLIALMELVKKEQVSGTRLHLYLDGRDVPYASAKDILTPFYELAHTDPTIRIASLSGRFYAMDRNNHWDRIEKAYRAMTRGDDTPTAQEPQKAIEDSYSSSIYDEEFVPTLFTDSDGTPLGGVSDGDALILFNIRADRARQITHAFTKPAFDKFPVTHFSNLFCVTLTEYEKGLPVTVAFEPQLITHSLSEIVSLSGKTQLHVAETEKYAHITYFLNDGKEEPFPGEKRVMIPSLSIESYDKKPEMSARNIAQAVIKAIEQDEFDFIAINFANADMVGHTGNMRATVKAIEIIDECLKSIIIPLLAKNGAALITADHGNAESLIDLSSGMIDKEHSNNPVPCIIVGKEFEGRTLSTYDVSSQDLSILEPSGLLSDVAPTVLALMGIQKPAEMTGNNLLDT